MSKFTFKKDARVTGLAGIGADEPSTVIKLRGAEIGLIKSPARSILSSADPDAWRIWFLIRREPTPEDPCPWRNTRIKATFASEPEAREWLIRHTDTILAKLDIFQGDNQ